VQLSGRALDIGVPVLTGPRFGGKYAAPMDLGIPTFDQAHGLIKGRPIQFDGRRPSLLTAVRPDVEGRTEHDIARRRTYSVRTYSVAELFDQAVDLASPNCAADMSPECPRSRRASHPRANRGGHVRVG
jgi:hypothetical protein